MADAVAALAGQPFVAQPLRRRFGSESNRRDAAFVAIILVVSTVLYVGRLWFYSDDWHYFSILRFEGAPRIPERPGQVAYETVLYHVFGLQPFPYHLTNALMIAAVGVLLYVVLRRLSLQRSISIAIALTYGLLPHHSVMRFWYTSSIANLSIIFALLAYLAGLRAFAAEGRKFVPWIVLSLCALVASAVCYEVAAPVLLTLPAVMFVRSRKLDPGARRSQRLRAGVTVGGMALAATVLIPIKLTTSRFSVEDSKLTYVFRLARNAFKLGPYPGGGLNYLEAAKVDFWVFGLRLPATLWKVFSERPHVPSLVLGIAAALATYVFLSRRLRDPNQPAWERRGLIGLGLWGVLIFFLGYSVFLTNNLLFITTTGIGARVSIAATLGVAMAGVAVAALVSSVFSSRWRPRVFAVLMASVAGAGLIINNVIATYWVDAAREERRVLAKLTTQLQTLRPGSTVLLDGVCPYVGPAIVFEATWDLQGALRLHYKDPDLRAAVIGRLFSADEDGIDVEIYGFSEHYSYGRDTFVYNYANDEVRRLATPDDSLDYFASTGSSLGSLCPEGAEGQGLLIL